jgi:UDP-glucuronate decarboxylase
MNNELCFDTTSKKLALSLNMVILRFGIIASFGKYHTYFRKKYGKKRFSFYRLTVCEVSNFDILKWDEHVQQKLLARRNGDVVWAWVKKIRKCKTTDYVYDFSVPESENFFAGNGVYCHNTYGPNMQIDDGRVISNFVVQALRGQDLTIYGKGNQTRSFCYVDDLIRGLLKIMEANYSAPINLGNPCELKVVHLAKTVLKLTGSKSKIKYLPLPEDDPKKRCPDITKAKKILGFKPQISLEQGLNETINYFKKKL